MSSTPSPNTTRAFSRNGKERYPPISAKARTCSGFTLLELIIVMVMIVIMTALVAPAVTSLGRSTGLVTGGNTVTNLIGYARQVAVGKNTMTALVVLARQGVEADYRAITVLEYNPIGGWTQITEWKTLPTGIIFDPNSQNSTFLENFPDPFPFLAMASQTNPPVTFKSADGKTLEKIKNPDGYAARIFLPTGGLRNPEDPAQLRLIEGFLQNGQIVRTRRHGADSSNFYEIAIIGATGATKVTRP